MAFRAAVTIWRFPAGQPASKTMSLGADGSIQKVSPRFPNGLGAVREMSLADIAEAQSDLGRPKVLIYALPYGHAADDVFVIASREAADRAGFDSSEVIRGMIGHRVLTRDTATFARAHGAPGYILIDVDLAGLTAAQVLAMLAQACPESLLAPVLIAPSSSSFVYAPGAEPAPGGWHVVVGIQNSADAKRAMQALFDRLWLVEGAHWVAISEAGDLLQRTLVDRATANPIQPHFFQHPVLKGLERRAPDPIIRNPDAEGLDTRAALPPLTEAEHARVRAAQDEAMLRAAPRAEEVRQRRMMANAQAAVAAGRAASLEAALALEDARLGLQDNGLLSADAPLHFDKFGWVDPASMFADPAKYYGQTMADPVEPEYGGSAGRPGRNKAICRLAQGGRAFEIVSLAHSAGDSGRKFTLLNPAFDATDAFAGVPDGGHHLRQSSDRILSLFEPIHVPAPTDDLLADGLHRAMFTKSGVPEIDFGTATRAIAGLNGSVLYRLREVGRPEMEDEGAALVKALATSGQKTIAVVCGDGSSAVAAAVNLAKNGEDGIHVRADIYGRLSDRLEPYRLIKRADACLKPKALAAVSEFAPRSISPVVCATSEDDRCQFWDQCGFIQNRIEAADHMLIEADPRAATTNLNALLGETAGPLAVFTQPEEAADTFMVPLADFRLLGGVYGDFAIACLTSSHDVAAAIRNMRVEPETLEALDRESKQHGISASPTSTEADTVLAVKLAAAGSKTTVHKHQIAFAVLSALQSVATVTVESKAGLTQKGNDVGPALRFVVPRHMERAKDHHASVAVVNMPLALCDPAAIGQRLFGRPVRAVSGGLRGEDATIFQCFDSGMGCDRTTGAVCTALLAIGVRPAVVVSQEDPGPLPLGVPVLNPRDEVPPDVGALIWLAPISADDIRIIKLAWAAGRDPASMNFRLGTGRWYLKGGTCFAAPVYRPEDDSACAAWSCESWSPILDCIGERKDLAVIAMHNTPCLHPISGLLSAEDLLIRDPASLVSIVAATSGRDHLEAAMDVCAALGLDDDTALDAALGQGDVEMTPGMERLADALRVIKKAGQV